MNIRKLLQLLPDKPYLQLMYFYHFHEFANLRNPKTFNEKLQWLKLYDRRPEYTIMVDKYAVKKYVADIIGEEYIIPTIGAWNKPDEINFDALPNQFVLKWNHDSKSVVICTNKNEFDRKAAVNKLRHGEKVNGFWYGREWPYKNVSQKIIAEKYLSPDIPGKEDLTDYKFFCFDGEPKYVQIIQDRRKKETIDFFDMSWNRQEFIGLNPKAVHADVVPTKPNKFKEMIHVVKKLSKDIPFSRIDLYVVKEHVFFGEITLYPASGFGRFSPNNWNCIMGDWIKLPQKQLISIL